MLKDIWFAYRDMEKLIAYHGDREEIFNRVSPNKLLEPDNPDASFLRQIGDKCVVNPA